jgi:hypothetical protein
MPMVHVAGWLRARGRRGGRPDNTLPGGEDLVDPGYGVEEGGPDQGFNPDYPSQGLPGSPGRPGHLPSRPGRPIDPGFGWPLPPVSSRPPVDPGWGVDEGAGIDNSLPPTYPVRPGHGLPRPPHVWPLPPRPTDPNYGVDVPVSPEHPIYPAQPGPGHDLPIPPGAVWPPLPPDLTGKVMCFVWIVGVGYRWTVIDTSLKPSQPLPPTSVPPSEAQPK